MIVRWESQGYFRPNLDRGSDPFVISMPPPNVTGSLHMGHAMFVTLEVVKGVLMNWYFIMWMNPDLNCNSTAAYVLYSFSINYCCRTLWLDTIV